MRDVTAGEEVLLALNEVLLVPEDVVTGNGRTTTTSLTKDGSSVDETGKFLFFSCVLFFLRIFTSNNFLQVGEREREE